MQQHEKHELKHVSGLCASEQVPRTRRYGWCARSLVVTWYTRLARTVEHVVGEVRGLAASAASAFERLARA